MTTVVKTETARPVTPLGILVEQLETIVKIAETTEIPAKTFRQTMTLRQPQENDLSIANHYRALWLFPKAVQIAE